MHLAARVGDRPLTWQRVAPAVDGIVVAGTSRSGPSAPSACSGAGGTYTSAFVLLSGSGLLRRRSAFPADLWWQCGARPVSQLGDGVDGLFLGRSAHDPDNLARILTEATGRGQRGQRSLDGREA